MSDERLRELERRWRASGQGLPEFGFECQRVGMPLEAFLARTGGAAIGLLLERPDDLPRYDDERTELTRRLLRRAEPGQHESDREFELHDFMITRARLGLTTSASDSDFVAHGLVREYCRIGDTARAQSYLAAIADADTHHEAQIDVIRALLFNDERKEAERRMDRWDVPASSRRLLGAFKATKDRAYERARQLSIHRDLPLHLRSWDYLTRLAARNKDYAEAEHFVQGVADRIEAIAEEAAKIGDDEVAFSYAERANHRRDAAYCAIAHQAIRGKRYDTAERARAAARTLRNQVELEMLHETLANGDFAKAWRYSRIAGSDTQPPPEGFTHAREDSPPRSPSVAASFAALGHLRKGNLAQAQTHARQSNGPYTTYCNLALILAGKPLLYPAGERHE